MTNIIMLCAVICILAAIVIFQSIKISKQKEHILDYKCFFELYCYRRVVDGHNEYGQDKFITIQDLLTNFFIKEDNQKRYTYIYNKYISKYD